MYRFVIARSHSAFPSSLRIGLPGFLFLMVLANTGFAQNNVLEELKPTGSIHAESTVNVDTPTATDYRKIAATLFSSDLKSDESAAAIQYVNKHRFFPAAKQPGIDLIYKTAADDDDDTTTTDTDFRWRSAIKQSLLFLSIQHGYAFTQPKTREALKGKFVKDYAASVKSLHGWNDGGRFFTNYIAHPLQGSFMGFIQIQNDPKGIKQRFGPSAEYWRSRMKAMAWSAAWSTQFEIGPVSQASIGNVGLKGKQTWIDIVVTPTVGTAFLITEDAMDRFVVERIERMSDNYYVMIFARTLLNPTRTMANIIRFKLPWHRDRKRLH